MVEIIRVGGCQCGKIRYEVTGKPIKIFACHCMICQKQSGSAFGMAAVYMQDAFEITKGNVSSFVRDGTGQKVSNYFCSVCGTRIYHHWFDDQGYRPVISVKPGTLDDSSWMVPGCHVWVKHAQPWIQFGDNEVRFRTQPADLDEMPNYI